MSLLDALLAQQSAGGGGGSREEVASRVAASVRRAEATLQGPSVQQPLDLARRTLAAEDEWDAAAPSGGGAKKGKGKAKKSAAQANPLEGAQDRRIPRLCM